LDRLAKLLLLVVLCKFERQIHGIHAAHSRLKIFAQSMFLRRGADVVGDGDHGWRIVTCLTTGFGGIV
jgi:hypothetical protein